MPAPMDPARGRYPGPGAAGPRTCHDLLPGDTLPDLVRYPSGHSNGPPPVQGQGPAPRGHGPVPVPAGLYRGRCTGPACGCRWECEAYRRR